MNLTVRIFASEVCHACEATIFPILNNLRAELEPRGIRVQYIEFSKDPASGYPRNVLRKLMSVYAYMGLCGTPMIVIENPPYEPRLIIASFANPEDMENQIVFQLCMAIAQHVIDHPEARWSFVLQNWKMAEEQGYSKWDVLDRLLKEIRKLEVERKVRMLIGGSYGEE